MGGRGSSSGSGGSSRGAAKSKIEHLPGGAMKTTFSHQGASLASKGQWTAHASKEYGASKTVYITATSPTGYQFKSSYSKAQEKFTNTGGAIDHAKAAASALNLI